MRAVWFGFLALASAALALGQIGQQPVVVIQQPGMIPQQLDIVNGIKPPNVEPLGDAMARARQQRLDEQLKAQQIEQLRLQNERLKGGAVQKQTKSPALAADLLSAPDLHTYSFLNGRAWLLLGVDAKQFLMEGEREGIAMVAPDKLPNYSSALLSDDEFQRGVDLFFADPSNVLIPILESFRVVGMKAGGAAPSDVESLIALMRRTAGAAPERTSSGK